ncbi:MAG: PilZ domain-containing protein [Candidatus Scalindua sp.]|nr:PilZ domain-containing protein [Candidatus Scalindua sp.]
MYEGIEKRKYERIENPFMVSFRIIPLVAKRTVDDNWDTVTIQDFGAGGVYFHYAEDIGIGELLDLKIGYPIITPIVHCVGKVVRVEESPSSFPFSIAIEFTAINSEEKEIIRNAIEEILERNNCKFNS